MKKIVTQAVLLGFVFSVALAACSSNAAVTELAATPITAPTLAATQAPAASPTEAVTVDAAVPYPVSGEEITAPFTRLNLNTASAEDFMTIPAVGNRMVREFMEYRPYVSIEQFRREIGKYVSAEEVAAYEQYVFVPISVNGADAATLMQILGLDQAEAEALISARPFASNDAFLSALTKYLSAEELLYAGHYLDGK